MYYLSRLSGVNFTHFTQVAVEGDSFSEQLWQLRFLTNDSQDGFDVYLNSERYSGIANRIPINVVTMRCPAQRAGSVIEQLVDWTFERLLKNHLMSLCFYRRVTQSTAEE